MGHYTADGDWTDSPPHTDRRSPMPADDLDALLADYDEFRAEGISWVAVEGLADRLAAAIRALREERDLLHSGYDTARRIEDSLRAQVERLAECEAVARDMPTIEAERDRLAAALRDGGSEPLQRRTGDWHRQRFPRAQLHHVALKLAEEAGEVASAVNNLSGIDSATGKGTVPDELADVVLVALVIAERFLPGVDVLVEAERKLALLCDPESAHPASLQALAGNTETEGS